MEKNKYHNMSEKKKKQELKEYQKLPLGKKDLIFHRFNNVCYVFLVIHC